MITVGIDEVGYGPSLGPLVVAAVAATDPLRAPVPVGDSKRIFSQARGLGTLEPAVLGFVPAPTFRHLLLRLGTDVPDAPWYAEDVRLPAQPLLAGVRGAWATLVDPADFNARTTRANKSDLLFEIAAELINRIRGTLPAPVRFLCGKHGGKRFYRAGLRARVSKTLRVRAETPTRSAYEIPGASIDFLQDAEDRHELVALASMIGKYVRERAMGLFNAWWAARVEGLKPTAGYGLDGRRFWRDIAPAALRLGVPPDAVRRLR
ncbi:MAG TPA: hypothetical protein VF950_08595 [Planctomycetota bacterium]